MAGIPISSKIISENPELERFREVVEFLEKRPPGPLFPEKWEKSAMSSVRRIAHKLLEEDPTISLKDTLTTSLRGCEDGLSGEVMLKITKQVIEKWEEMHQTPIAQLENQAELV